jgi:hypothetical protein
MMMCQLRQVNQDRQKGAAISRGKAAPLSLAICRFASTQPAAIEIRKTYRTHYLIVISTKNASFS